MNELIEKSYQRWLQKATLDSDLVHELDQISRDEDAIQDRFYKELEFGTGGLRGIIGAGTNRMNIYTVGKATQGYANYLNTKVTSPSVAIAYDSRIKSDVFSRRAAEVFAANGIRVHIYMELMPTPSLSFAIRHLRCSGGVVVTASHNPSKYNGYKVYGADGCQITTNAAKEILGEIAQVDSFRDVKSMPFEEALAQGLITYIEDDTITAYIQAVSSESLCSQEINRDIPIVYTPLNGAGLHCVTRTLKENGFTNITVVPEQEQPDGNFPTCPYPNPEMKEALELGIQYARRLGSELLLATDPDCDRVGTAVRSGDSYILLSGNEMGLLLFDYICKRRIALHSMPDRPILIKTIVTTDLARKIAEHYGVEVIDTLTGFKYIGEQIGLLEANGEENRYLFGFEESYGYLSGGFVRDKDGVNASLLICEMIAYYKMQHTTVLNVLEGIYQKFGYCLNTQKSFAFEGAQGFEKMQAIMADFREVTPEHIGDIPVEAVSDYQKSMKTYADGRMEVIDLPKSNVLKFELAQGCSIVIRPSGTEPKLKIYICARAKEKLEAVEIEEKLAKAFISLL